MPYEFPGPISFEEWRAAVRLFAVAMRAVGAAARTRLDMYANKISRLNDTYGSMCRWLVAQADQRVRAEHIERIRRKAEE